MQGVSKPVWIVWPTHGRCDSLLPLDGETWRWHQPRHTLTGRQDAVDRAGLRGRLLRAQAEAGDIVLLFADASEALTHPYLAHVWAERGATLRVPAPSTPAR